MMTPRPSSEGHPPIHISAISVGVNQQEQSRGIDGDTSAHFCTVLEERYLDTLTAAGDFAADLHALGKYEQARRLHEDILTRSRRILGEDHPDTVTAASNLAAALRVR